MALTPGRNKVQGRIKQGGGPDSARGPCVCHLCSKLSDKFLASISFPIALLKNSVVLSFGFCYFVFSFWLLLCICFSVLGKSTKTLVQTFDPDCDWPWATCLELSVIYSVCASLCWICFCAERTRLCTKAGFYQHWEGQLKPQSSQRSDFVVKLNQ